MIYLSIYQVIEGIFELFKKELRHMLQTLVRVIEVNEMTSTNLKVLVIFIDNS